MHSYLFICDDDIYKEILNVVSFKDAILELFNYTGDCSELFKKCIKGFENDDIDGLIALYNQMCQYTISTIYEINKIIYRKVV